MGIRYDSKGRLDMFSLFEGGREEVLQIIANGLEIDKDLAGRLTDVEIQKLALQRGRLIEQIVPYPILTDEIMVLLRLEMAEHNMGAQHRTQLPGDVKTGVDCFPSQRETQLYAFFRLCDYLNNSRDALRD